MFLLNACINGMVFILFFIQLMQIKQDKTYVRERYLHLTFSQEMWTSFCCLRLSLKKLLKKKKKEVRKAMGA